MKPYIVNIVDKSNVSESVKYKITNDVPDSLDSSIRDTQLIQPHTEKPVVKYLFKDDLKDRKYNNEHIVDELIQLDENIKRLIILEVENNKLKESKQYNLKDEEASQISHVEINDASSHNSKIIRIETVESNLKGLEKFTDKLGQTSSLHMLELFDNRNKQLLDIIRYGDETK